MAISISHDTSSAPLSSSLPNVKAIWTFQHSILRIDDFAGSFFKIPYWKIETIAWVLLSYVWCPLHGVASIHNKKANSHNEWNVLHPSRLFNAICLVTETNPMVWVVRKQIMYMVATSVYYNLIDIVSKDFIYHWNYVVRIWLIIFYATRPLVNHFISFEGEKASIHSHQFVFLLFSIAPS